MGEMFEFERDPALWARVAVGDMLSGRVVTVSKRAWRRAAKDVEGFETVTVKEDEGVIECISGGAIYRGDT